MTILALLITALLFGGMMLYSFGFAAFLFSTMTAPLAGQTLRRAFPYLYLFVIFTAVFAAAAVYRHDRGSAVMLAVIALTTWPTRQYLMPAINQATDQAAKGRFKMLHGLSVAISLAQIALAGTVLARFI